MPRDPWQQRPFGCDGPALNVAFQKIGVFLQVFGGCLIARFAGKIRRANQRRNVGRQRGGGIAARKTMGYGSKS